MQDQYYNDFDDYYKAGKGGIRSKHPEFHIFRFEDLGNDLVNEMGPFRTNYYQFAIGSEVRADITVFDKKVQSLQSKLVIFVPGQLIHWKKTGNWTGYVINVKESFLKFINDLDKKGTYKFLLTENPRILDIDDVQYAQLAGVYEQILVEYDSISQEHLHVIESYMQILLIYIKRIFDEAGLAPAEEVGGFINQQLLVTANNFKELVLKHYLEMKSVGEYAGLLAVTPGHLNDCVKISFGKTAKEIISEVLILDARAMLGKPEISIKAIADRLNFEDYSHFVKFFKSRVGISPAAYRKELNQGT